MTIVVVTHERDIAAYATRLITFRDGRVKSDERQASRDAAADLAARDLQPAEAAE
jgi:putative ABC transport system ATP-binding protein